GTEHAMARHHDGQGVGAVRLSHRAERLRLADGARDVAVARRFSIGHALQRPPDLLAERGGSGPIELELELAPLAGKVLIELAGQLRRLGRVFAGAGNRNVPETDGTRPA